MRLYDLFINSPFKDLLWQKQGLPTNLPERRGDRRRAKQNCISVKVPAFGLFFFSGPYQWTVDENSFFYWATNWIKSPTILRKCISTVRHTRFCTWCLLHCTVFCNLYLTTGCLEFSSETINSHFRQFSCRKSVRLFQTFCSTNKKVAFSQSSCTCACTCAYQGMNYEGFPPVIWSTNLAHVGLKSNAVLPNFIVKVRKCWRK